MGNFVHLIGVPYEKMNCWELCCAFYRDVLGLTLKHYIEDVPTQRSESKSLIYSNLGDFEKVEGVPRFGDLILIKIFGIESHIAVYLGNGRMLHTARKMGSHVDRVAPWEKMISGFYRQRLQG